jgi:DNA-binding MarR family transcriptional regulator
MKPSAKHKAEEFTARREKHDADAAPAMVQLDPVIHERTRLAILTSLFTVAGNSCSFLDLRETLQLTDGNLMAHLRTLESAGLIEREKEGAGRKSSTTVQLSTSGKRAFKGYLDNLESLVRTARGGGGSGTQQG